jgi:hypothetical protein
MLTDQNTKRIGVIVGREWSWPPRFIEEINRRDQGVVAEFVKLGGTAMNEPNPYSVIIDRISHEIPYYRTYLKNAVLQGTVVINNPFWWSADDKFFGACLADQLGIAHPKTVALPTHSYIEGVVEESLRNLEFPIPWEQHIDAVGGFPVIMKPVWGGGFKSVYKLNSYDELWAAYNETGTEAMMLQEYIAWDKYARCLCIGQDNIMVIKFDPTAPWPHRYFVDHAFLTAEEGQLVLDGARKLNQALGYDMNTVEFAIKDGVPYAIDFTNPAPDFDVNSLTPHYFEWVVNAMADLCIDYALGRRPRSQAQMRWDSLLNAGMPVPTQPSVPATESIAPNALAEARALIETSPTEAPAAVQQATPVATTTVPKRAPRKRKDNGTMTDAAARADQQAGVIAAGEEGQPEEQPKAKRSRRKATQEG